MTSAGASTRPGSTLAAIYGLVLRSQLSVPRLLGIGALGGLAILLGSFSAWADDPLDAASHVVAAYGLGILVPLAALWLGTAAIGDLVEDRLLVYVWLKPVPRWQLPAAAILATVTLVVPLAALPTAIGAAAGDSELAVRTFVAATLAALAYSALFVAAGLWFRRAVWWGLAFLLLWENVGATASDGTARFTVTSWGRSIVSAQDGVDVPLDGRSAAASLIVLPLIAVAGWIVATARYRRTDID
jgi:ABC-2 type transport system permease protein